MSRLILWILKNCAVSWRLCGASRWWIDHVCFQPCCNPLWLTGLKAPTTKLSTIKSSSALEASRGGGGGLFLRVTLPARALWQFCGQNVTILGGRGRDKLSFCSLIVKLGRFPTLGPFCFADLYLRHCPGDCRFRSEVTFNSTLSDKCASCCLRDTLVETTNSKLWGRKHFYLSYVLPWSALRMSVSYPAMKYGIVIFVLCAELSGTQE